jgi:hypothetical protein
LAVEAATILVKLSLFKDQLMEIIIQIILGLLQLVLEILGPAILYHTGLIVIYIISLGQIKKSLDKQSLSTLHYMKTNRLLGLYYREGETYISKNSAINIGCVFWLIMPIVIIIVVISAGSA